MKQNRAAAGRKGQKKRNRYLTVVMDIYVILLLTGQMLVYDDFYYNMLETKYRYFYICTIGMLLLVGIYGVACLVRRVRQKGHAGAGTPADAPKARGLFRGRVSAADVMMLVFLAVAVLSMLCSPFRYEAMWGNEGRYMGAFMLMLWVGIYFCVSRFYEMKAWHIQLFLAAGMLVCLFGITDYFDMDLLHFKAQIRPTQRLMFTSFIGNINTYTACVALIMGMAGVLFASCAGVAENIWYGFCITVAFAALITGQSDNSYLSLAAFFGFLPLYLFRNRKGFRKYIVLLALFVTTLVVVAWTQNAFAGTVVELTGLFGMLMRFPLLKPLMVCLWILTVLVYAAEFVVREWKKRNASAGSEPAAAGGQEGRKWPAWLARAWWIVIAAVAAAVAIVVCDATFAGHADRYGALAPYVQFGDDWGTHRGYIWRIALENYMKFPLLQKILGHGPDTFGLVTWFNNLQEMASLYGEKFDSVHNEFLQLFVTIGPLGLLSYLGVHLAAVRRVVKSRLDNPYIVGALFAVLCYNFQAVVNISQPIVTPVMWVLMCMMFARQAPARKRPYHRI